MITREGILVTLQELFRDILNDETIKISSEMSVNDGSIKEWDSLKNIELIVSVEKEFHIRFGTEEIQRLNNIGTFIEEIYKKNGA